MSAPTPAEPTPAGPTSAGVEGGAPETVSANTGAVGTEGSGSPGVPGPTPTPPAPSGALDAEAATGLQAALAAEQAAVWAYGLVAAYDRDNALVVQQMRSGHLLRRDATAARLVQGGAEAGVGAAAYLPPAPVTDAASARALAQAIETDCAAAWRALIGSTDDNELRGYALAGLSDAAVRLSEWKQLAQAAPFTIPFPGQP